MVVLLALIKGISFLRDKKKVTGNKGDACTEYEKVLLLLFVKLHINPFTLNHTCQCKLC